MDRLRTFGIVAHIDAGKTTLTERILHDTGAQPYFGSVDDGTATMDWMPAEKSRGISITAAATRVDWGDCALQVVDTPGHVDFVAEVERCLNVLDSVVVVVDSVRGVESQTEVVWEQAAARGLPRLVFVNKLDRPSADFTGVVADLARRFACRAVPLVVPLLAADGRFAGLADAVTGAIQWFEGRPDDGEFAAIRERCLAAHEVVVEAAADCDDAILADVLAGSTIAPERLRTALRDGFLGGRFVPVLCGAALWNRGVDWLLDAMVALLPGLADVPRTGLWSIDRAGDPTAPFAGFVFKVHHGDEVWNFVRVVRGRLVSGLTWCRAQQRAPGGAVGGGEIGEVWLVQADRHTVVATAGPGEIVVLPGELGVRTGDTICSVEAVVQCPVPRFPAPVLAVTFEPEQADDGARLAMALRHFAVDDPTLRVDKEHGQIVVRGMGELHLDIVAEQLRARVDAPFAVSRPRVARRETLAGAGRGTGEVRANVAGRDLAARCEVRIEVRPGAHAEPAVLLDEVGTPAAAVAIAELRSRLAGGFRSGPMGGVVAAVTSAAIDGDAGDAEALLQQAAAKAVRAAVDAAGLVELEPEVAFEVWAPEESGAAVLADLGARGADLESVASGQLGARLRGRAPLARMLGYVTKLRSITKGRGHVALRPADYTPVR